MSNYLKYFKEEFEKYAQDIGAPPARPSRKGGGGAPARPAAGKGGGGTGGERGGVGGPPSRPSKAPARPVGPGYSPQAIKDMQAALQALAQTVSATIDYDALMKTMSTPPGQPSPEDKSAFDAQYGRDMFSNFMVANYLRRADVHGVEYDSDPKRTKMMDKKPADLKAMFVILDSMRRIGSEAKESFVDGNWGPRTNNALRNASAIASAVMKLGGELGMESRSFDPNKITELNQLVPAKDTDISAADKAQRAPKIAEILNGVSALFKDFKQQVFLDPTYRNFIDGKTPMMTFGPAKDKGVDASEGEKPILADLIQAGSNSGYAAHPAAKLQVSLDKKYIPEQFGRVDVKPFEITGGDLVSQQAFENWVARSNVLTSIKQGNPESWPAVISSFLEQVVKQVDSKLGGSGSGVPQSALERF